MTKIIKTTYRLFGEDLPLLQIIYFII